MSEDTRRHVAAVEHLKVFADDVLEAFQSGAGVPEPINLAVAKRLLWSEFQRTILALADPRKMRAVCQLRISGLSEGRVFEVLRSHVSWAWSARCVGPRDATGTTVVYATGTALERGVALENLWAVVSDLRNLGAEVRDYSMVLRPIP